VNDAAAAAALLAIDPALGACLRGAPGPARDGFLAATRDALPGDAPWRKMPAGITDDRLLGGLDLAATLAAGRQVAEPGLLAQAHGGMVIVAMAERLDPGIAARLAAAMDTGIVAAERDGLSHQTRSAFGVIALDEGIEEAPPAALIDRLAFQLSSEAPVADMPSEDLIAAARQRLPRVVPAPDSAAVLVTACAPLGIASLRAPLLALRAARAAAALAGRLVVDEQDLQLAARLVLAPRATTIPEQPEEAPEPPPPHDQPEQTQDEQTGRLADRVLDAARAALPADLLATLARGAAMRAKAGGSAGAVRRNAQRGRTIGTRNGDPKGGARLHLLATLRAAAPWQALRRVDGQGTRIAIRKTDFRIRRFYQSTRTTTIFVVDASGSAAVARLAEAKGAVETLLAECYVRRDRVALLCVRGGGAEMLLPPTSSLARAKRCLAAMPGGGGTPLAAGFVAARVLADGVKRGGQTPLAVFLTDGRPNIALDGAPGRPGAEADALATARAWRASGHAALLVDTAMRPHPFARTLAEASAARYLALPRANSDALQLAVRAATAA
jgi:magnesium chelatase subunit D